MSRRAENPGGTAWQASEVQEVSDRFPGQAPGRATEQPQGATSGASHETPERSHRHTPHVPRKQAGSQPSTRTNASPDPGRGHTAPLRSDAGGCLALPDARDDGGPGLRRSRLHPDGLRSPRG
jgi:hypothetical protein